MSIVDESYDINQPYFKGHSYIEWLESFTIDETLEERRRPTYSNLLRKLWTIPFHGSIGNDSDRGEEGLELRVRYNHILAKNSGISMDDIPNIHELFGRDCRVLEMLIALSMRMYDIMQDMGFYNSVSRWFWEIMENVGFDFLDDDTWSGYDSDKLVEQTVNDIMNLKGDKLDRMPGGWFHVEGWQNLEIWYQMHAYLGRYF